MPRRHLDVRKQSSARLLALSACDVTHTTAGATMASMTSEAAADADHTHRDPYLWLEEVTGEEALDWVRARNEPTLADVPRCGVRADAHRGARGATTPTPASRTSSAAANTSTTSGATPPTRAGCGGAPPLDSYRTDSPEWDVLIDVDELGPSRQPEVGVGRRRRHRTGVHARPGRACPGGSDASIVREFDMLDTRIRRRRVRLPEAKSQLAWVDADTVLVGTDFGADSLTESGYPR